MDIKQQRGSSSVETVLLLVVVTLIALGTITLLAPNVQLAEGFSIILVLLLIGAPLAFAVFWVLMFLDIFKNKRLGDTERLLWGFALLIFFPLAILYYFAAYRSSKK